MVISMGLPAKTLAKLAVLSGVAAALPTASIVWAQAQKGQADPPRTAVKAAITVEVAPVQKVEVVPAKTPPPADVMERAVGLRLALPAAPGAAQDAAPEPMVQQITQQLRPLFRAELRFLTSTSDSSPTQRREIAIEGARAVKDAARKLATVQHALQNGGWRGGMIPDGRKLVREGLQAAAKAKLTPEQFARYQEELDGRARDQRRSITLNLVANLDRLLFLNNDQREKIGEALLANWNDTTFPTLENLVNYEAYFPVLPDRQITPLLNDAQRTTWNGVQKVTFGQSFNFQFNNGIAGDPADEDEDEKAAMAEVEKKK